MQVGIDDGRAEPGVVLDAVPPDVRGDEGKAHHEEADERDLVT
jgi:hypothetical protein